MCRILKTAMERIRERQEFKVLIYVDREPANNT